MDLYFLLGPVEGFEESVGADGFEHEFLFVELNAGEGVDDGDGECAFSDDIEFDVVVVVAKGDGGFGCLHYQRIISYLGWEII